MRRLRILGLIGGSVLGLLWLALRSNPEVARFLAPCAAPFQLLGFTPAWVIDTLGNIVVFIPVGAGVALIFARSKGRLGWFLGIGSGLGLSLLIEFLQVFSPTRVVSWRDVMLNTLGAFLGAGLVAVSARRRCQHWRADEGGREV